MDRWRRDSLDLSSAPAPIRRGDIGHDQGNMLSRSPSGGPLGPRTTRGQMSQAASCPWLPRHSFRRGWALWLTNHTHVLGGAGLPPGHWPQYVSPPISKHWQDKSAPRDSSYCPLLDKVSSTDKSALRGNFIVPSTCSARQSVKHRQKCTRVHPISSSALLGQGLPTRSEYKCEHTIGLGFIVPSIAQQSVKHRQKCSGSSYIVHYSTSKTDEMRIQVRRNRPSEVFVRRVFHFVMRSPDHYFLSVPHACAI